MGKEEKWNRYRVEHPAPDTVGGCRLCLLQERALTLVAPQEFRYLEKS